MPWKDFEDDEEKEAVRNMEMIATAIHQDTFVVLGAETIIVTCTVPEFVAMSILTKPPQRIPMKEFDPIP